ncbi:MAG: toprim domain-containing protein, partial [bacterium]
YTDVMRLSLTGQKNVVATSGTALTELQSRLVRRYTDKAVLLYDSDTAGAAATLRGADILVEQGVEVRVAEMAEGEDPDSFVQKHGIKKLKEKLANALPLLDFKANRVPKTADPVGKSEQLHSIINTLARIQDGIRRQDSVRQYAEKLKIEEAVLWDEISRVRKLHLRRRRRPIDETEIFVPDAKKKSFAERSKAVEEELIRIMLLHWDAIPYVFSFMELTDFYNDDFQLIATVLYQLYQNDSRPEPEELIHYFTEPFVVEFITKIVVNEATREGVSAKYKKWAADCLAKLQRIMLDMRIEEINEQIRERQQSGGDASELLERWQDLQSQRRRVKAENFLPQEQTKELAF